MELAICVFQVRLPKRMPEVAFRMQNANLRKRSTADSGDAWGFGGGCDKDTLINELEHFLTVVRINLEMF